MQRPVFAANWKMHHGPDAARAFVASFLARCAPRRDRTVIVFPPAISVHAVVTARGDRTDLKVGVQNIHTEEKGAFTGEISAVMSREAGAAFALVGHSERRHAFGETDEQAARKCSIARANELTPILCVGETIAERDAGATTPVVLTQLRAGIADLPAEAIRQMAIAYEPVWAIGTGRTATPEDAALVHAAIREALTAVIGPSASEVPILYGGSVNRQNAKALLNASNVDGLLVGGASLDPESWAAIVGS